MRVAHDLQIVVGETNDPERGCREHRNPDVGVRQVCPQQRRHDRRRQDQQPAHGRRSRLGAMRLRSFLANHLPDLEIAQLSDHPRPKRQAECERRQARGRGAERDVPRDVEDGGVSVERVEEVQQHQPNTSAIRSATRSVRVPREPFTSTISPSRMAAAMSGAADALWAK